MRSVPKKALLVVGFLTLFAIAGASVALRTHPTTGTACTLARAISDPAPSPDEAFDAWLQSHAGDSAAHRYRASDFIRVGMTEWHRPLGPDRFQKIEVAKDRYHPGQWTVIGDNNCQVVHENPDGTMS
ncbi:MAG: hypothetical protein JWM89_3160 [Acidimicrobiales bacterium]|nr:hypothetical protein [Acidimicrobiales bacterium]